MRSAGAQRSSLLPQRSACVPSCSALMIARLLAHRAAPRDAAHVASVTAVRHSTLRACSAMCSSQRSIAWFQSSWRCSGVATMGTVWR